MALCWYSIIPHTQETEVTRPPGPSHPQLQRVKLEEIRGDETTTGGGCCTTFTIMVISMATTESHMDTYHSAVLGQIAAAVVCMQFFVCLQITRFTDWPQARLPVFTRFLQVMQTGVCLCLCSYTQCCHPHMTFIQLWFTASTWGRLGAGAME